MGWHVFILQVPKTTMAKKQTNYFTWVLRKYTYHAMTLSDFLVVILSLHRHLVGHTINGVSEGGDTHCPIVSKGEGCCIHL